MGTKWSLKRHNHEYGPYSWEELQEHGQAGVIADGDLVKSEEMPQWISASEVPGLIPAAANKKSAPPPGSASPDPQVKKGRSPFKTLAIIGGSIVGLAALGVIALLVIGLFLADEEAELKIANVNTSLQVTPEGLPVEASDVFETTTADIFVSMEATGAQEGTILTSTWFWEDEDYLIDSGTVELPAGTSQPVFNYAPTDDWPAGAYRVDISVDDNILANAHFRITGEDLSTGDDLTIPVEETEEALHQAVQDWWSKTEMGRKGKTLLNYAEVDQEFFDEGKHELYEFAYDVKSLTEQHALLSLGYLESEVFYWLEFEQEAAEWVLTQERSHPSFGYDMINEVNRTKENIVSRYGENFHYH